jgi:hypothetical protein
MLGVELVDALVLRQAGEDAGAVGRVDPFEFGSGFLASSPLPQASRTPGAR